MNVSRLLPLALLVLITTSCGSIGQGSVREAPAFQLVELACTAGSQPVEECFTDEWLDARDYDFFSAIDLTVPEEQVARQLLKRVTTDTNSGRYYLEPCLTQPELDQALPLLEIQKLTADGKVANKIYEKIISDTRAEIAATLKGKVSPALAGSIEAKVTSQLSTKLENSNAISGDGRYVRLKIASGLDKSDALKERCSGYPVVDGLKALAIEKLTVQKDSLSQIEMANVVELALQGNAEVTESVKAELKVSLQSRWEVTRSTLIQQQWSSKVLIPVAFTLRPIGKDADGEGKARKALFSFLYTKLSVYARQQQQQQQQQQQK